MFRNPFERFRFEPFGRGQSRKLFGYHTTPREWKHGARDIPFGMGAQTLYVDDTNGHDSNDGESWKTAKKTIQEAVDAADSWTQIFIKAGTYAENVSIPVGLDSITLIGESRSGVIVMPTTGTGIDVASNKCKILNLTAIGNGAGSDGPGVFFSSSAVVDTMAHEIAVGNQHSGGFGVISYSDYVYLDNVKTDQTNQPDTGVYLYSAESASISNCDLSAGAHGLYIDYNSNNCKIFNNIFHDAGEKGCFIAGGARNVIYHNNFINNPTQILDTSGVAAVFENFYDDHTNIDNGFGIATEPYTFYSGSDPRPVTVFNGWNAISLQRSLLRKKTAAQTSQAATDANGTSWVDLKTIAPTTSDIELYRIKMTTGGTWAGTAKYRIIIGSTKVYPFGDDKDIDSGVLEDFVFPINIQINETCKIQFRSTDASDGAGETVTLDQIDYTEVL